jgi:prophage DNA circulation protein
MHLFNATETISDTTETIAFLEELLAQQKQLSALQKELETLLQDAAKFDPLDHESKGIQEQIDLISNQVMDLIQYKVDGDALKARDLIPVLIGALNSPINTLISVHCGTPQPCTHCGADGDGDVFIC